MLRQWTSHSITLYQKNHLSRNRNIFLTEVVNLVFGKKYRLGQFYLSDTEDKNERGQQNCTDEVIEAHDCAIWHFNHSGSYLYTNRSTNYIMWKHTRALQLRLCTTVNGWVHHMLDSVKENIFFPILKQDLGTSNAFFSDS